MKQLVVTLAVALVSTFAVAEPDDNTVIFRAYAPTVAEAQAVVDGINNGSIKACSFGGSYDTYQKAYAVNFPTSATWQRINAQGQLVTMKSKTTFKVSCKYRD